MAFDGERTWMRLPLRFTLAEQPLWLVAPEPPEQDRPVGFSAPRIGDTAPPMAPRSEEHTSELQSH